eukprot:5588172-Prymnesium_polylepis.1
MAGSGACAAARARSGPPLGGELVRPPARLLWRSASRHRRREDRSLKRRIARASIRDTTRGCMLAEIFAFGAPRQR